MKTNNRIVVIIEDSKVISETLKFQLESCLNFTVYTFENAKDGIKFIKETKPDYLILDYHLDHTENEFSNGMKVIKYLKSRNIEIPTVVLSGQSNNEVTTLLINSGVIDYVNKNNGNFNFGVLDTILDYEKNLDLKRKKKLKKTKIRMRFAKIMVLTVTLSGFIAYLSFN